MHANDEEAARGILRSGSVVALIGRYEEWEVTDEELGAWFRLRRRDKENEHPDERRYLKVGSANTEAELLLRGSGLMLYTVEAGDVLRGEAFVQVYDAAGESS